MTETEYYNSTDRENTYRAWLQIFVKPALTIATITLCAAIMACLYIPLTSPLQPAVITVFAILLVAVIVLIAAKWWLEIKIQEELQLQQKTFHEEKK